MINNGGIPMRQEGKTTEFKREYTDDLKYTVVAFANTDGGKIYIGIHDDGSVHGVQNTDGTMLSTGGRDQIKAGAGEAERSNGLANALAMGQIRSFIGVHAIIGITAVIAV